MMDDVMKGMMGLVAGLFALFWAWFFWQLSTLMGLCWLLLCLITVVIVLAHDENLSPAPRSYQPQRKQNGIYIQNLNVYMHVQTQQSKPYGAPKAALSSKIIDIA